jgi:hypothetical protein
MSPEFIAILQKLVAEQGRETLFNTARCKSFLADYTRNEFKKESRLLLLALDAGVQKAIDTTDNITICKKQQIRVLREDHFMAEELAVDVVDALALVLKGDTSRTEIQNEIREEKPQTSSVQPQQPAPKINAGPKIGDIIPFGNYKWRVLDVQGNEALIITEDIIEKRNYIKLFSLKTTWEGSELRAYLNGAFYNTFGEGDKKLIAQKKIPNPDNLWYYSKGGKDTQDRIFLLSLEEVDKYFGDSGDYLNKRRKTFEEGKYIASNDGLWFSNNHDIDRVANYGSEGSSWWWLRSPGWRDLDWIFGNMTYYAASVSHDGSVNARGCVFTDSKGGVRPALWLKV